MVEDELASSVVWALSQYLTRKAEIGAKAYDAQLEDLLSQLEAKLSIPYLAEVFERFKENPADQVEVDVLRLNLAREIRDDPAFAQQLSLTLGGRTVSELKSGDTRKRWLGIAAVVVALPVAFVLGRSTSSTPAALPETTKVNAATSTAAPVTTTTATSTTSSSAPSTTAATPGVPGDGGTLAKGAPVLLSDLPRPNDKWTFQYGDHDVQLTQYQSSLWSTLTTCNSDYYSGTQQFRLKNFSRIEVKAVGTDSTSDPGLAVKFEIFVNNDTIHPVATALVNPGEAKPLAADLPANTFALTLRSSLTTVDKTVCRKGNAVWGSPYAVASGS
ncbi:hypothetical protein [Kutzneria albida]|uniref:Uncharacterized protein n=1 Tax=Kutzneria albida DSM 43870 TaxID=1449976 RepID=W5WAN8_9PSEU|nr:hypothetical protein [Kutzneria albida]AHH95259.1 hypothetical protein KALB_1889 [Kutzneria albida DSM 43870]